jgi:hypothetical protein
MAFSSFKFIILLIFSVGRPFSYVRSLRPLPLHASIINKRPGRQQLLYLNRVFVENDEIIINDYGEIRVHFPETDNRCKHIREILKMGLDDVLKVGILDVGATDSATIIDHEVGDGIRISVGKRDDLKANARPSVDMILAVPRPLRLERILPVVSCMGVGKLVLVGAAKVQLDYFGEHRLELSVS